MRNFFLLIPFFLFFSCSTDALPKPKAYLRLSYEEPTYKKLELERPYVFETSNKTVVKNLPNNWLKILYPDLKASIDITYREVEGNLKMLLMDSEKLVFKHTQKAEQIGSKNFVNFKKNVFGTIYDITGNAASQIQFHLTDSTNHFIKGALYFYARPNYDSIFPAVSYLKKDILRLIETTEWK
jgi:gliding motility-associated lipoprotein GldD